MALLGRHGGKSTLYLATVRGISTFDRNKCSGYAKPQRESRAHNEGQEVIGRPVKRPEPEVERMSGGYLPHEHNPDIVIAKDSMQWMKGFVPKKPMPTDFIALLQHKYDFSMGGARRWWQRKKHLYQVHTQRFIPTRHGILGPDLATAHFITYRQGKVKFAGSDKWWDDNEKLPAKFDERFKLIKADATDCNLIYEAFDNFLVLKHLEELNLTGNRDLDDWVCDRLCRQFRFSKALKTLNLTGCQNITERGLSCLYRIPSLNTIIITDTAAARYEFLDLVIDMFHDSNPKCEIVV